MADPTVQMNVRLSPELFNEVSALAACEGLSLSAAVRQLLATALQPSHQTKSATSEEGKQ